MERQMVGYLDVVIWVILLILVINAKLPECEDKNFGDRCLITKYHKDKPGPELLEDQCQLWKNHSCCTANNSRQLQVFDGTWHNFAFNHCRPLNEECQKHFIQDLCFYECASNIGPWIVDVNMISRKKRYFNIPLCKTDCDHWWEACKYELTCRDNWIRGFNWTTGTNVCPIGHKCKTFETYFKNASNFCQQVWDGSFKVVSDKEPCMTLGMNGSISQNQQVTEWYIKEVCNTCRTIKGQPTYFFVLAVLQIVWFR